jgi:hypothetical protein
MRYDSKKHTLLFNSKAYLLQLELVVHGNAEINVHLCPNDVEDLLALIIYRVNLFAVQDIFLQKQFVSLFRVWNHLFKYFLC